MVIKLFICLFWSFHLFCLFFFVFWSVVLLSQCTSRCFDSFLNFSASSRDRKLQSDLQIALDLFLLTFNFQFAFSVLFLPPRTPAFACFLLNFPSVRMIILLLLFFYTRCILHFDFNTFLMSFFLELWSILFCLLPFCAPFEALILFLA